MNSSSKNYLIAFLLVTALGGGALAWQQYLELVTLRAAAIDPADRAAEAARLAAAQRYARELEDQLAATRAATASEPSDSTAVAKTRGDGNQNQNGRGRGGPANFRALLQNPEMQRLMSQQQKAALDSRYAALFKSLNLSPAQLDQFKALLLEKQSTLQDVMGAARDQGVDPRTDPDGFKKLVAASQADLDASLKATLGDSGFAQYQQYQQSQPQRNAVSQLQQSLSYTDTPLSEGQAAQLTQILAATSTQYAAGGGGGPGGGGAGGGGPFGGGGGNGPAALITTQTIAQAQGVLSTTQLAALQQLQQTQQAQQQIEKLMRAAEANGGQAANRTAAGGG